MDWERRVNQDLPDWLVPMAATLTQERFSGPEWVFERKLDGIRLLAYKRGSAVRLLSRNAQLGDARPWERACAESREGVIAKRRDAPYEHRRSRMRLKMKCEPSQDFIARVRGHWVKPEVIVSVAFIEWTVHRKLRHSRLLEVRR